MRVSLAIAMATLTFGWASRPMLAQVPSSVPALESIHMIDSLIGWAVTHEPNRLSGEAANALVRTVDGGSKWKDVTPRLGQQNFFYLNATNLNTLTSHFAWLGPFRTLDGGRTWRNIPTPGFVRSIHFIDANEGWLLSYQGANNASVESAVYRSGDGGETWTKVASSRNGAMNQSDLPDVVGGDVHITFLNATTGWIERSGPEWSYLYVTHDGGSTWRPQTLNLPPQVVSTWGVGMMPPKFFTGRAGILPVLYTNIDRQSYRPTAAFAVVYVTHDAGTTWRYTTPISVTGQTWGGDAYGRARWGMNFADVDHGWMADDAALYVTNDGGRHWTAIQPAGWTVTIARQLDFISPRIGWAVTRAFPFLLKTLDGGRTWTPLAYTISRE